MRFRIGLLLLLSLLCSPTTQATCTGSAANPSVHCYDCSSTMTIECVKCEAGYGNPGYSGCTVCPAGTYSALGNAGACTACPAGLITYGTAKTLQSDCFNQITGCETYASAGVCSVCILSLKPFDNGSICGFPIQNCKIQTSASQCTECEPTYVSLGKARGCGIPIPNCLDHDVTGECLDCERGYSATLDRKACAKFASLLEFQLTAGLLLAAVILWV